MELVQYYREWGWIDFLSEIAKTKVFDIYGSGLDSIECAKNANAYKVLMYASNEKLKAVATASLYKQK